MWFLFIGFIRYSIDEVDIWFSLLIGGGYYVAKLMEIKSIEKVVLLGNLQKQGSIPFQTVVLQLINEVEESYRRRQAVYGRWICYFYPGTMFWGKPSHTNQADDSASRDAKVSELRAALGPLSGRILKFCTDACLRRYLEARNWNLDKAKKMLEETLKWRFTYKPEEIRWHEVAHEGETGKVSKGNFHDRLGRTVLIMRPGKQNTSSPEGNIRHLVYLMENAILNLPEGQEQMSWLIDFNGWSLNTNIPIKTARDIIYILQNHYPERLAIVVLYSPPRFFEAFWKVVKYFIDTKTFEKIKFVYPNNKDSMELMKTFFDTENLPSEFGGKATLNYDHEEFSRLMAQEDVKTAKFWGYDDVATHTSDNNGYSKAAEVTPVLVRVALAAS